MKSLLAGLLVCWALLPGQVGAQEEATGEAAAAWGSSDRTGVVKGRAVGIDVSDSLKIIIDTDSGRVKLNALPTQIADLTRGDIVAFRYRDYGGELWIELDRTGTAGAPRISAESFGQMGVVSGQITRLDKSRGRVFVHGRLFRAHPETLKDLLPGAFVDVTYVQFGNAYGAVAIRPVGAGTTPTAPGMTPGAIGGTKPSVGGSGAP